MSDIANRLKEARRNKRKTSFYNWFFFRSRGDSPFAKLVIHAVLIFASLVSIYPALRVLSVSLRSGNRVVSTSLDLIPTERVQIPADMTDEEFEEYRYRTPEGVRDRIRDLASGKQTSGDVTKSFTYPNGETVEYVVYDVMTDLDFERAIYTPPQDLERAMIEELSIGVNFIPATITYVDAVGDTQTQNFQIPDGVTEEMLLGYINEQVENNNFVNQPWRNRPGTLSYAGKTITPEFVPSNLDTFTFRDEMLFEVQQTKEKAYITATGLNYAAVLFDAEEENRGFLTWIWNSILITMSTAFLGMTLASTAAYAFSRFTFPGKRTGLIFLLGTQMIPAAMMMLPIYLLADAMGLIGSLNGLIFAYSVGSIPFSIWILKGYYDTIPYDLEEAARIDGATQMQTFFRIILPLAAPALAIVFLFNFMAAWNDYLLARILLAGKLQTWVLGLVTLQGQFATDWGKFSAAALMVSVPVVILFLASSKYLVSGLTLGSVKG